MNGNGHGRCCTPTHITAIKRIGGIQNQRQENISLIPFRYGRSICFYYVSGEDYARFVAGYMLDEDGNVLAERDPETRVFK